MVTVIIIALMLVGLLAGYTIFSRLESPKPLTVVGWCQRIATYILLLTMGLWLGGNKTFWSQLRQLGVQGLLFAMVTVLCSAAGAWLVSRLFFRSKHTKEAE